MQRRTFARYLALFIPSCLLGAGLTKVVCEPPQPTTEPQELQPEPATGWGVPSPTKPLATISSGSICFRLNQDVQKYYDDRDVFYRPGRVTATIGYALADANGLPCVSNMSFELNTSASCQRALDHVEYLSRNYRLSTIDMQVLETAHTLLRDTLNDKQFFFSQATTLAFPSQGGEPQDILRLSPADPKEVEIEKLIAKLSEAEPEEVAELFDRLGVGARIEV